MATKRQKSAYRELQSVAKRLQLPGNAKYPILQEMVKARQEGNEALVQKMISDYEQAKMERRAEKQQSEQTSCKARTRKNMAIQEVGNQNGEVTGDARARLDCVNVNQRQSKNSHFDALICSLLFLPQEKRIEMIRAQRMAIDNQSGAIDQYMRPQDNELYQSVPCCSSRTFLYTPTPNCQTMASEDPHLEEYYRRNQHFGNYNYEESTETNGNFLENPPPINHTSRTQELVVPFIDRPEHYVVPSEFIYEEPILMDAEEITDHHATFIAQITGSPNSDTLSSDETQALLAACNGEIGLPFVQDHQPAVRVEFRNEHALPSFVERYCQLKDFDEETLEILSESDSDALHITSSVESKDDNEDQPPSGQNKVENGDGLWTHQCTSQNYLEL